VLYVHLFRRPSALHNATLVASILPVRRLNTGLRRRKEPVTYWMTVSDEAVLPGGSRVLAQARHGLRGAIPDGVLVRVSSLDPDPLRAYASHDRFVREWLASSPRERRALLGSRS
jgi:hypothetical protein